MQTGDLSDDGGQGDDKQDSSKGADPGLGGDGCRDGQVGLSVGWPDDGNNVVMSAGGMLVE